MLSTRRAAHHAASCSRRQLTHRVALGARRYPCAAAASSSSPPVLVAAAGLAYHQHRLCGSSSGSKTAAAADGARKNASNTAGASSSSSEKGEDEAPRSTINPRAEDLYARLGVPRAAPWKQIKAAWKTYKRDLHNQGGPADAATPRGVEYWRMKEAYHVLSDASSRAVYDKGGSAYEASHAKYHNGFMKVHNHQGQDFVGVAVVLWFLYMSFQWSRSETLLENYVTFFAMLAIVSGLRQLTAVVVLMSLYTPAGWAQVQKVTGKA